MAAINSEPMYLPFSLGLSPWTRSWEADGEELRKRDRHIGTCGGDLYNSSTYYHTQPFAACREADLRTPTTHGISGATPFSQAPTWQPALYQEEGGTPSQTWPPMSCGAVAPVAAGGRAGVEGYAFASPGLPPAPAGGGGTLGRSAPPKAAQLFEDDLDSGHFPDDQAAQHDMDPSTTVMIQNISRCLTRRGLMDAIHEMGFEKRYNYVHMPLVFGTGRGRGFAFINFVDEESTRAFTERVLARTGNANEAQKRWRVAPARVQGFRANAASAKSHKVERIRNKKCRPLVMTAERDAIHAGEDAAADQL